jgi:hypothetical protein
MLTLPSSHSKLFGFEQWKPFVVMTTVCKFQCSSMMLTGIGFNITWFGVFAAPSAWTLNFLTDFVFFSDSTRQTDFCRDSKGTRHWIVNRSDFYLHRCWTTCVLHVSLGRTAEGTSLFASCYQEQDRIVTACLSCYPNSHLFFFVVARSSYVSWTYSFATKQNCVS